MYKATTKNIWLQHSMVVHIFLWINYHQNRYKDGRDIQNITVINTVSTSNIISIATIKKIDSEGRYRSIRLQWRDSAVDAGWLTRKSHLEKSIKRL